MISEFCNVDMLCILMSTPLLWLATALSYTMVVITHFFESALYSKHNVHCVALNRVLWVLAKWLHVHLLSISRTHC